MFIFGFFLKIEELRFFNWKLKKLCRFLVSPLKTIFGCKNENVKYNYIDLVREHSLTYELSECSLI